MQTVQILIKRRMSALFTSRHFGDFSTKLGPLLIFCIFLQILLWIR